ncbi:tRNA pseudouridine(38-40) synthase TruA [Motiliproteus sp. MSK22-1]|uniref:tRNA pseudouridine(38-40) synthase TruA n=1 Tax=Motiliproteus sp. MSK22-1 TaxID=1897630 RepID=UPI000977D9A6|nr:tRNA pseudouridine(38-40) synthase TruA [Motiliproteus sp. MSK22-1]OMH38702.1 tRNA pseudouridine(38-40) synthase TruA [Motiliproteus sp. MSK22-1]
MDNPQKEEVAQPPLCRYAVCVEYDGSKYHGWQSQPGSVNCVQEAVEAALGRVANHPVSVICAGRTDSGVHASYQIIHFDSAAVRPERGWLLGSNTYLPDDICIKWIKSVSEEFHARFSALERRYRYVIFNGPVKPALLSRQLTWTFRPLDEVRMQEAANYLVGTHDFSSYRAVGCQAHSPVRDIRHLWVRRLGQLIVIDVRANAFLHHMIRNIAGVLMKIGSGDAEPIWAKEVLESRDRREGGVTAPPFGLYFVNAIYPDEFNLPKSELGPVFLPQFD